MNDWLEEQEKYTRKNSLLILNPHLDARDEKFLARNVVKLIVEFLEAECIEIGDSKTFRIVPRREPPPHGLMVVVPQ